VSSTPTNSTANGSHAIVIGGSMAGLLAARVLADHFDHVTIVDRDRFPMQPEFRKGVPQSRHAHLLLVRGWQILDQLFPGLRGDLVAAGAPTLDLLADYKMLFAAGWAPRIASRFQTVSCSRELLEWNVRRQLSTNPRVTFCEEREVIDLISERAGAQIAGVRIRARGDNEAGAVGELRANLVADASGRSSRAPQWLATLGYPAPEETTINSFLGYASRYYKRPGGFVSDWKCLLIAARPPENPRGAGLFELEGDIWHVTLAGAGRDYPPTDDEGYLAFAKSLVSPIVYEAIKDAEPCSSIYGYQRTENRLRHYERMPRWPQGLIVLGDAVCAFNPVYGQGMTVAACGAMALDNLLREERQAAKGGSQIELRFQQALARSNSDAWLMATGEDFRYPTTEGGKRPPLTQFMHWYMNRVLAAATRNTDVLAAFAAAAHLLEPPSSLFHPRIMAHALRPQSGGGWKIEDGR
jgi:2-polyprenyl-6-methoxyphenol hydroxylase-like FAD-dependent oxidoreductase